MIYDIEISDQVEIDLRGIFEYIAFELQAPENASGQLDRLEACIMDLDHMPKRYRQYELEPDGSVIQEDPYITQKRMVELLGLSRRTVQRLTETMITDYVISRVGSKRTGQWEIL